MYIAEMEYHSELRSKKNKRLNWLKHIAIPEIVENVKELLNELRFFEQYGSEIKDTREKYI